MSYLQRLREKHSDQQRQATETQQEAPAQRQAVTQQEAIKAEPVATAPPTANRAELEYDQHSHQACGMIQCRTCKHWCYSQCRNRGYGSADPERWRRCKGYEYL